MRFVAAALTLLTSQAFGAPLRSVRLRYSQIAASSCPDQATVRSAVVERLGFDPFDESAVAELSVTLARVGNGIEARVALTDETGRPRLRTLGGTRADCADLAAVLPFALSVAIESFSATPVVAEPTSPPVEPPPPPAAKRQSAPAITVPWRPGGSVAAFAAFGAAPTAAFGVSLGFSLARGAFSVALEGFGLLPSSFAVQTGRIETSALQAVVTPCLRWQRLRFCATGGGGVLWSRAIDLPAATAAQTPLASIGARVAYAWPLLGVGGVVVFGEFSGALARTRLKVGETEVWALPPVFARLGLAFELEPHTVSGENGPR